MNHKSIAKLFLTPLLASFLLVSCVFDNGFSFGLNKTTNGSISGYGQWGIGYKIRKCKQKTNNFKIELYPGHQGYDSQSRWIDYSTWPYENGEVYPDKYEGLNFALQIGVDDIIIFSKELPDFRTNGYYTRETVAIDYYDKNNVYSANFKTTLNFDAVVDGKKEVLIFLVAVTDNSKLNEFPPLVNAGYDYTIRYTNVSVSHFWINKKGENIRSSIYDFRV
jgi:hypothetical protein